MPSLPGTRAVSINAASTMTAGSPAAEALRKFAYMPATSGISHPRIAPATLALVLALHAGLFVLLANYRTEVTPPVPPVMVTLITPEPAPETPKPEITPPKPLPAAPKPVKKKAEPKPEKKPVPVPVVQPEPQLVSQAPAPVEAPPAEPPAPVQEPEQKVTEAPPQPQPVTPPPAPPAPVEEAQVEPPSFNADYLDNPAPAYPAISRRLGEQGRVLLRVQVAPGGTARNVVLHKSSGFDRLDRIALETVRRWKFVPARQGDKPVEAWVIVPIQFNLKG
jgi:periplasmic protein TonB